MPCSPAISAIQTFLKTGQWIALLLALTPDSVFYWRWYAHNRDFVPLQDEPLTVDIAATWLLTFLFRKLKDVGTETDYTPSFLRIIVFLRDNCHLNEIRPLLQFLATFQQRRLERGVLPSWFELALVPLFREEFIPVDPRAVEMSFKRNAPQNGIAFWRNLLQALSLEYVPFWINTSEYIMKFILYELLQQITENIPGIPGSSKIRAEMIQKFLADKPLDFFKFFQADLLILLAHQHFLTKETIRKILFNRSRREIYRSNFLWTFLHLSSLDNQIVLSFLKEEFRSLNAYASNFSTIFSNPNHFFKKLLETPEILKESGILVKDMEKFFHLFFWNTSTFFPMFNQQQFIKVLINLQPHWRNLIVQLYRSEANVLPDYLIQNFVKNILNIQNVRFDKTLFDTISIYMTEVISKSSEDIKISFLGWLLFQNKDVSILAHFQLNADLVKFAQQSFQGVLPKRALFWSLFLTQCVGKYQGTDRNLNIDMGPVCEQSGLQITEMELNLMNPGNLKQTDELYSLFGVIQFSIKFREFVVTISFPNPERCQTRLNLPSLHPFRFFVISLKMILNAHTQPDPMLTLGKLKDFVEKIAHHQEFMQILTDKDRKFLISLFQAYLPILILSDELLRLLRELSLLLPVDVKQAMFECCSPLKMLDNEFKRLAEEKADAACGRKRSRDPSDQSSYEAVCSLCPNVCPLREIGVDHSGNPVCRKCSQSRGIAICTLLDKIPFASL